MVLVTGKVKGQRGPPLTSARKLEVTTMSKQITNATLQQAKTCGWPVKQLGPMVSADLVDKVHGLGLRPGKQALAVAMALRDVGTSGSQIVMACGAPQLNRMRGLIADGHVKRDNGAGRNEQGHTVYRITLTPKGEKRIASNVEREAKAALTGEVKPAKKAKGNGATPRKPRAPKVAPVMPAEAPQGEPAGEQASV